MGNWQKVKIGQFLFERKGKYKPDGDVIVGLKRINKIDFSGNFHISIKSSKTNMILICPGDLVISGINVSKGAIGIYTGKEDVTATIHYSSYTFDTEKINVEFFKRFLKSPEFIKLLQEQVKGGIKTEIKPKHILPLEIDLPAVEEQAKLLSHFKSIETEERELRKELTHQQTLLKKLRQQILQEAIEGKLTADWREQNADIEPAGKLLARIKAEKDQLTPFVPGMEEYLYLVLKGSAGPILGQVKTSTHGTCRLESEIYYNWQVALPPLPEQKAIVQKVEKLLAICDQLETRITSNQTHAEQLMQAVLQEAFSQTTEQPKQPNKRVCAYDR